MIHNLSNHSTRRSALYGLLFVILLCGRALLPTSSEQGTLNGHILQEFAAALLALFVGTLALVRFYTKKNNTFLFIGTGFMGAGLLDGYHVASLLQKVQQLNDSALVLSSWNWNLSRIFLALLLFGSWFFWQREDNNRPTFFSGRAVGLILLLAPVLVLMIVLPLLQPFATSDIRLSGRIETFLSATFFLWAFIGYLDKGLWRNNLFDHWIVISLLFSFVGQAVFLLLAHSFFDVFFNMAHSLKLLSYLSVLIGLLISMHSIFKRAEQNTIDLTFANRALQNEIAERRRAEKAEQEQRQLAEALREVGLALSSTLNFNRLLERLLDQVGNVLPYDTANVMLVEGTEIRIEFSRGYGTMQLPRKKPLTLAEMPTLQQMYTTKEPLVISDTADSTIWVNKEASPHVRSWAGVPIAVQGEVVAFMALNHSQSGFYKAEDAARLTSFTGQASIAIQNAWLYEALQKRIAELTTLNILGQVVTTSLDLDATLRVITEYTTDLLDVAATSVVLRDNERGDLWFAAASGEAADFVLGKRLALGQGILGWVVEHGEPLLIADAKRDSRHFTSFDQKSGFSASTILCVPLLAQGQTIGAIETMNKRSGPFNEEDLHLLTSLANPAAAAIENAHLYEQAQQEIRERKRIEAALESERTLLAQRVEERTADLTATNAELARAVRLKDEFLASMSHELRTPLNAILGISEALQEQVYGALNEKQLGSLQRIEESGRHLLDLINDILDLSKVEAGKLEMEFEPSSVESVCQASLNFIKRDAQKKRLTVHYHRDETITVIQADERRLKQILVNLLSNAVKFTDEGGELGLEVKGNVDAEIVTFRVWDTGIGIRREDMSRLFKPFVQLDSRLSRQYSGTGLGLSLVYRFTEMHGGSVSLESEPGQGSQFTVALPWIKVHRPTFGDEPASQPPPSAAFNANGTRPRLPATILIAEDTETILYALDEYLRVKGFRVIKTRDGQEAVEQTLAHRPDLILMDIQMPVMDGLEAIRRIRASESEMKNTQVPIIALTALAMPGDRERCLQAGANGYLSKPVRLTDLIKSIGGFLPGNDYE